MIEKFESIIKQNDIISFKEHCNYFNPFDCKNHIFKILFTNAKYEPFIDYLIYEKSDHQDFCPEIFLHFALEKNNEKYINFIIDKYSNIIEEKYLDYCSVLVKNNNFNYFYLFFNKFNFDPNDENQLLFRLAIRNKSFEILNFFYEQNRLIFNKSSFQEMLRNGNSYYFKLFYKNYINKFNDSDIFKLIEQILYLDNDELSEIFSEYDFSHFKFELSKKNLIKDSEYNGNIVSLIHISVKKDSINFLKLLVSKIKNKINDNFIKDLINISLKYNNKECSKFLLNNDITKNLFSTKIIDKKEFKIKFFNNLFKKEDYYLSPIKPETIINCAKDENCLNSINCIISSPYFFNFYNIQWLKLNVLNSEYYNRLKMAFNVNNF